MSKAQTIKAKHCCDECGFISTLTFENGTRHKCDMCGHTEVLLDPNLPTPERRYDETCVKCSVCPFTIGVCQECECSIPWDMENIGVSK